MTTGEITVYGTTSCPDCWRSKRYLESQNVPYSWVNISEQPDAAQTVMRINGGARSVPTIVFPDGSVLVEPGDRELGAKLGLR